jgi:predicted aminopeptidase
MAFKALRTEHSGAKKWRGAYWGQKVDAKRESNRKRRENAKAIVRDTEKR